MDNLIDIASVISRIMFSVDHEDRETFKKCWAENIRFDLILFDQTRISYSGRDELIEKSTSSWSGTSSALRHQVGNLDIQVVNETTAHAHFYCSYVNVGHEFGLAGMGEYSDVLIKHPAHG